MKEDAPVNLPVDVYSPDHLSILIIELHNLASAARSVSARSKVGSQAHIEQAGISAELTSLLKTNAVGLDEIDKMDTLHKLLDSALKAAPVIHVTLAGLPSRLIKRQITVWFRTRVHAHTLLTFAARRDIGGGIILNAGSHMYDFSYRQMILANPKRLGELISV